MLQMCWSACGFLGFFSTVRFRYAGVVPFIFSRIIASSRAPAQMAPAKTRKEAPLRPCHHGRSHPPRPEFCVDLFVNRRDAPPRGPVGIFLPVAEEAGSDVDEPVERPLQGEEDCREQ